jgi:hypothetical protein
MAICPTPYETTLLIFNFKILTLDKTDFHEFQVLKIH